MCYPYFILFVLFLLPCISYYCSFVFPGEDRLVEVGHNAPGTRRPKSVSPNRLCFAGSLTVEVAMHLSKLAGEEWDAADGGRC